MKTISPQLQSIFNLAKVQSKLTRRYDNGLGGLGFTEFAILYYLESAPDEKIKRIDLANKVGLTASGITRLLLPMEKVGYINREVNPKDARVSYVILAPGGKRRFEEELEDAELLTEEIIPKNQSEMIKELSTILSELTEKIV